MLIRFYQKGLTSPVGPRERERARTKAQTTRQWDKPHQKHQKSKQTNIQNIRRVQNYKGDNHYCSFQLIVFVSDH